MTSKMPKPVYQIIFSLLLLAFTVAACNNEKKEEKKETVEDTTTVKPVEPMPPVVDTTKMDTASTRPVKDPN